MAICDLLSCSKCTESALRCYNEISIVSKWYIFIVILNHYYINILKRWQDIIFHSSIMDLFLVNFDLQDRRYMWINKLRETWIKMASYLLWTASQVASLCKKYKTFPLIYGLLEFRYVKVIEWSSLHFICRTITLNCWIQCYISSLISYPIWCRVDPTVW